MPKQPRNHLHTSDNGAPPHNSASSNISHIQQLQHLTSTDRKFGCNPSRTSKIMALPSMKITFHTEFAKKKPTTKYRNKHASCGLNMAHEQGHPAIRLNLQRPVLPNLCSRNRLQFALASHPWQNCPFKSWEQRQTKQHETLINKRRNQTVTNARNRDWMLSCDRLWPLNTKPHHERCRWYRTPDLQCGNWRCQTCNALASLQFNFAIASINVAFLLFKQSLILLQFSHLGWQFICPKCPCLVCRLGSSNWHDTRKWHHRMY